MATNLERLTIKDTFTDWRDKLNALIDVAVLAPMADEDGIMNIDVEHCNAREVRINVPVKFTDEAFAHELHTDGSFVSSIVATTIPETVNAALMVDGTEGYFPWASGPTRDGFASMWTSSFDNLLHFSYITPAGDLVNTFSWNPETNTISVLVEDAAHANESDVAKAIEVEDKTGTDIPGSYPIIFGTIDGDVGTGNWSNALTYDPHSGTLTAGTFKGNLDGNAKTATTASKLASKQKITLSGDADGSVQFDGSVAATLPITLKTTGVSPNLYGPSGNVNVPRTNRRFVVPSFRVDAKGRVTEAYTRTVEFPYPEVDVDTAFSTTSVNPIANKVVAQKFAEVDQSLSGCASTDVATTSKNGLMSSADKIKLNSLTQLPRISSVAIQNYDASTGSLSSSDTKTLSTAKTTKLIVNAKSGMSGTLAIADTTSGSELSLNLSLQLSGIAGSGLKVASGKLTVPGYVGATASAAGTSGLVPSATAAQKGLFLNGAGQWANPVGTTYGNATTSTAGLMSPADKTKLDGVQAGATKVAVTRSLTSGTKIATITINGVGTDIYGEKNTDTTYTSFVGATASAAGQTGLVPTPAKGAQAKYLRGDATWQTVYDASQIDAKLNSKANIASPALTGTPTAPTANAGTNSTQIATTAFVSTAIGNLKGADCPTGLDTLKEIAASIGNNTNFKGYVDTAVAAKLSTNSSGYVKGLSISNRTITITKGDNSTATITIPDNTVTYSNFVRSGSNAAAGLVPKPPTTAGTAKYLCEDGTWTVPPVSSDNKVTNTLNTTARAYITGTTSNTTNTGGQVFDTGVFLTTTAGTLQATTFVGELDGNAKTATTLKTARNINGVAFDGSKNITVADSTKLPLTGGTLTGNLVIKKGGPAEIYQNTDVTKGTNPASGTTRYWSVPFTDGAGTGNANRLGLLEVSLNDAGTATTAIRAYRNTSGATTNAALAITYEAGGTSYATCPTPATADSSTKIATTAFVKAQGYITGSGNISGNAGSATKLQTARKINGVSFDGTKDITIADSTKVAKTGDTMTGNLTLKGANLAMSVLDTTEGSTTYRSDTVITAKSSNSAYGINAMFGGSSNTVVGAGEGKSSLLNELAGNASENVYIIADNAIIFNPNANTYANRKTITLGADGKLTGLAGVTATTFTGDLVGTANKANQLTTARKINGVAFDGTKDITVADSTKVAKAGDTMSGNLIIAKAGPILATRSTGMTRGTRPSEAVQTVEILGQDSAGKATWGIYHQYDANMGNLARLICYKGTTTDNTWSGLGVGYDSSGNAYTIAPTPAAGSNTTHIATTAWVRSATGNTSLNAASATKATQDGSGNNIASTYAKLASPTFTGTPTAPTAAATTNTTQLATTAWVRSATGNTSLNAASATKATQDGSGNIITSTYAKIASPTFTGTPAAPTAAANTNSTQIATTAWVRSATGNTSLNAATATKATQDASGNVITSTYAKLASPTFTGTPKAPTAAADANSTQIATTAWVRSATGNTKLNAATASKLGTATVGGASKPIYLDSGTPKACSSNIGATNKPVYMNGGAIAACTATAGGTATPVYMSGGTITACTANVGGTSTPVYMANGAIKACSGTAGSATTPVYLNKGAITACTGTQGSGTKPVYLNKGAITACTGNVGSGTKPVYMSSGAIAASTSTVGTASKPVYLNKGTITACTTTLTGAPNWSGKKNITNGQITKAPSSGYIIINATSDKDDTWIWVRINCDSSGNGGTVFNVNHFDSWYWGAYNREFAIFPVQGGTYYIVSTACESRIFVPCTG